jgi:aminoglycoside phosphotransferase (APT) family kinase protein
MASAESLTDPALPPKVAALVAGAFGGAPIAEIAPTTGGFSHLSRFATIGGRLCVIKAADQLAQRADIRREALVLPLLRARGLPTPQLLALAEDDDWTVAVTAALPGAPGLSLLDGLALPAVYAALGRLLARLHAGPPPAELGLALAPQLARARAALPALVADGALRLALADALEHPAWQGPPRLIHGDLGLHNLLWDGNELALLDWEWAAAGPPLLDVAWLRWTIAWRHLPVSLWDAFLAGYGQPQAAAPASLRAMMLGQIGLILLRVAALPAARAEWLRRAGWTLDSPEASGL